MRGESGYTKSATPCDPRSGKPQRSDIIMGKNFPHNYNTNSITKRVNHVTTFKNAPNVFKIDRVEKITTHICTDYLVFTDPKKDTITVEPLANHINCKTAGNIRVNIFS